MTTFSIIKTNLKARKNLSLVNRFTTSTYKFTSNYNISKHNSGKVSEIDFKDHKSEFKVKTKAEIKTESPAEINYKSPITNAPFWNYEEATTSEATIKAENEPVEDMDQMKKNTIDFLNQISKK